MRLHILLACLALLCAHTTATALTTQRRPASERAAAFEFAGAAYYHRFTKGDQHEYTPEGQENLSAWTDMITLHRYPAARDGDALAATANAVLENYKANKALILRTDSVPRSPTRPAEHLIVAVFPRPDFIEVAFARFRMVGGVGTAAIYSHRVYGQKAGNAMQAWLEKNGQVTETHLMKWDAMPAPSARR